MVQKDGSSKGPAMTVKIGCDPTAVREGLAILLACPVMRDLDVSARGTAEIVLAEVLNNIVEHAYTEKTGEICISLNPQPRGIHVRVCDKGLPFPHDELPLGGPPRLGSVVDLPEGGFGWFLIRNLVQDLTYRREAACNHLSFLLPAKTAPDIAH